MSDPYAIWELIRASMEDVRDFRDELEWQMEDMQYEFGFDLDDPFWEYLTGPTIAIAVGRYPDFVFVTQLDDVRRATVDFEHLIDLYVGNARDYHGEDTYLTQTRFDGEDITEIWCEWYEWSDTDVSMSYTIVDDYLLFGITQDALADAIRTYRGDQPSIEESEVFDTVLGAVGDAWFAYADGPEFLRFLRLGMDQWEWEDLWYYYLPTWVEDVADDVVCDYGLSVSIARDEIRTTLVLLMCP